MLKSLIQVLIVAVTAATLAGCNKSKSDNNATSTDCFNNPYNASCNNTAYNNYGAYGYQAYPYGQMGYSSDPNSIYRYQYTNYYQNNWGTGSSLCACPTGSRPVYNGNIGMGCLNNGAIPNYSRTYYWSWSAGNTNNNHYVNWNQVSNINNGHSSNNGCYNNVAWSCFVGQSNQCPSGTTCKATAQNSPMGVCVQ